MIETRSRHITWRSMTRESFPCLRSLLISTLSLAAGCGGPPDGGPDPGAAGGAPGTGGTLAAGGTVSSGGAAGGGSPAGGTASGEASGGAFGSGGVGTGAGGTGGAADSGGATGGGAPATGGMRGVGGDQGSGGALLGCAEEVTIRAAELEGYGSQTTGGDGGNIVHAGTGTEIHAAICGRAADDTPLVIMVDGTITPGNTSKQSGSCNTADGVIELKEISNISLIGVGTSGVLDQIGIHIRAASNIIIQNLTIKNVRKSNTSTPSNGGDAIGMESTVSNVWIDHNEIYGSTTDGEEHDGLIDFKRDVTNVTVSYNHLHDAGRGGLIGSNDDGDDGSTNITFHHNWYENLNSRTHLIREAQSHIYNNYYSKILSTGINSRNGARLLIEGNYFTEARNPLGTFFYLENPGTWQVADNYFSPSVVWEESDDQVPAGPNVQSTGSVSVPYPFMLDAAECVPAIVQANAGAGKL